MSQVGDDGAVGRKVPCGMESQEGRSRATLNHGAMEKMESYTITVHLQT